MASKLSTIPSHKRQQLAATLGLFAVLFVAVGAVALNGPATFAIRSFVAVAMFAAVLLALMGWGVAHSVRVDRRRQAEQGLDDAIASAVAAAPGGFGSCDCGHEHDPTELHVSDDPCERDGAGHECTHTCDTCVLASLRSREPEPAAAAASRRPLPGPRD